MSTDLGRFSKKVVQMIWDPEPRNDDAHSAPIWCLGRQYAARPRISHIPDPSTTTKDQIPHTPPQQKPALESRTTSSGFEHVVKDESATAINGTNDDWPTDFLDDFESRIWLTYRSNFPPIPKSEDPKAASNMSFSVRLKSQLSNQNGFTTDTGWGCMIRSGQSLLANSLAILRLGRDRRRGTTEDQERELLSLFADDPRAPFSIHKFVEHGAAACGTYPGQWFGPSATAKCIEALSSTHTTSDLAVYVTGDGPDVFEDTLYSIARDTTGTFRPTLLLVGTRLGIDRVTPVYRDALCSALTMPQSVGIAGGRPSSSHYFVGMQASQPQQQHADGTSTSISTSSNFFYLDPHFTRPALPYHSSPNEYTAEEVDSCHTRRLRRLSIDEMDPSMLIAFLFRNEDDWKSWRRTVSEAPGKAIFHVADSPNEGSGLGVEREAALDEVETLDEEHDGFDEGADDDVDEAERGKMNGSGNS